MNQAGEQRRIAEAAPQDFVHFFVGVENIAIHLRLSSLDGGRLRTERKTSGLRISGLDVEARGVDGRNVDSRRGPRFHPVGRKSHFDELLGQAIRRRLSDAASFHLVTTDEEPARQEGPGGQNNRLRLENRPGIRTNAADF